MEQQTDEYQLSEELYAKAVDFVKTKRQARVTTLQRVLSVRYRTASMIIDRMEAENKIGPFQGNAPRRIFI